MKTLSKKSVLLLAAITVCVIAVPSMASAASWGVVGTEHTLDSPNFSYRLSLGLNGVDVASCTATSFTTTVTNSAFLTVTSAAFKTCVSNTDSGFSGHCTTTWTGTHFPWYVTGTTTNVQILGMYIDVRYDSLTSGSSCTLAGTDVTLTGSLTGGQWTGNGAGQHEVTFANDSGLRAHGPWFFAIDTPTSGTLRDTAQTLTLN
jgi:hypothetical protein